MYMYVLATYMYDNLFKFSYNVYFIILYHIYMYIVIEVLE